MCLSVCLFCCSSTAYAQRTRRVKLPLMPSQELQRHDATQAKKQRSGSSNGNTQSIPVDAGRTVARAQGEEAGGEGARGERREEVLTGEAINVGQCCLKHPTWTSLARLFSPWSTESKAGGRKGQVAQLAKVVQGHLDLDQQSTCSRGGTERDEKDEWEKSSKME